MYVQVLCMSREEFSEFKVNDGWEEDDQEEDEQISQALSNTGLPGLKTQWKWLIHEMARVTLRSYGGWQENTNVDKDLVLMEDTAAVKRLSSRQLNALQVRYGQKNILYKLMELTKT